MTNQQLPTPEDFTTLAQAITKVQGSFVELHIGPFTAFNLVGFIQLAIRHPDIPDHLRQNITQAAHHIKDQLVQLTGEPKIGYVLDRGFDPANDVDQHGRPINQLPLDDMPLTPQDQHDLEHILSQLPPAEDAPNPLPIPENYTGDKDTCACAGCRMKRGEIPYPSITDFRILTKTIRDLNAQGAQKHLVEIFKLGYLIGYDRAEKNHPGDQPPTY